MNETTQFKLTAQQKRRVLARGRPIAIALACSLYVGALLTNALLDGTGVGHVRGIEILLTGWVGLVTLNFAWLANPLFLSALVTHCSGNYKLAAGLAGAAALVALRSFKGFDGHGFFPSYERDQLEIGFYLWLAALVVFASWAVTTLILSMEVEGESAT